jgi:lycopene beta-cyclase
VVEQSVKPYDLIIVGAGAAGLSLAQHFLHSPLGNHSILIVEQDAKERNDRTWCFWTERPTRFDVIVYRTWRAIQFAGGDAVHKSALQRYRFQMIRGADLYAYMRHELAAHPNVTLVRDQVRQVASAEDHAHVVTEAQTYAGRWAFDSRLDGSAWQPNPARHHLLRQHFKGWLVETPQAAFDPACVTLLDFRTPQKGEMRFFYVLPFSARKALVEFVLFSRDDHDQALRNYVEGVLGLHAYRVIAEESGVNPLTDRPFPRRASERVLNIGVRGGRLKPSSGYAFMRIQQDSAAIVQSLLEHGHPFDIPVTPSFYRLCDALMLHVMQHQGGKMEALFSAMFRNNPVERIFRFLDEAASPRDEAAMIASMPPYPFLQALFQLKVLRQT